MMTQQLYQNANLSHHFKSDIINEEQKLIIDSIICGQARKETENMYTALIDFKKADPKICALLKYSMEFGKPPFK